MVTPQVDLDHCSRVVYDVTADLKVRVSGVVSVVEEQPSWAPASGPILVYVKTLNSSIDELPVIASMLEATSAWRGGVELYEYESLGGEGDRYAKLAKLLAEAMRRGRPFLALVPQLMTVRLVEGLSQDAADILESSVAATVEVEKEDLLYLPRYVRGGGVEVVVKESSASSPERAEILKAHAREAGIRVVEVKRLPDNSSIMRYVLERGVCSALERIPVTRLSRLIYALTRCTGLSGLVEKVTTGGGVSDKSILTVYSYGVPGRVIEELIGSLQEASKAGWVRVGDLLKAAEWLRAPLLRALQGDVERILKMWWCA